MKAKNIIISAFFLALAASYIYFFEIPAAEKNQQAKKPFSGLTASDLQEIEIKNSKTEFKPAKFVNYISDPQNGNNKQTGFNAQNWKLDNAEYSELDPTSFSAVVNQLLATDLGVALPRQEIDPDMSVYGLQKPDLELSVRLKQQDSQTNLKFSFGKRSEFVGKRYVSLARDASQPDLYMLDDLLYFAANKPVQDFRKQTPLQIEDAKQKRISVSAEKFAQQLILEKVAGKIALEQKEVWQVLSPYKASAEEQVVTDMLRAIKNLKLKKIIEGPELDSYRQVVNKALIEISLSEGPELQNQQSVRIARQSAESPESVISWSKYPNTLFVFEDDKLFSHFEDAEHYRKLAFFRIDSANVKTIEVFENGTQLVKAVNDTQKWTLSGDSQIESKPADAVFIEEYLQDLAKVSAIDFPAADEGPEQFGFESPALKIILTLRSMQEDKDYRRVFVLGKKFDFDDQGQAYFAGVDDLSEPFIIDEKAIDRLKPKVGGWVLVPTPQPTIKNKD